MKNILGIFLILLILSCGSTKVKEDVTVLERPAYSKKANEKADVNPSEKRKPAEVIVTNVNDSSIVATAVSVVEKVEVESDAPLSAPKNLEGLTTRERVEEIMKYLTSDELQGRDSGSEGIELAAQYIEAIFKANNIAPYFETYRDKFSYENKPVFNVVGYIEGTDENLKEEFIVIGAHYDHIGMIQAVNGDAIANGANDNASGTAVVLELARYFAKAKVNRRSLIFVLFSAEEKGLLGSKHLAKRLKSQNLDLYTMLNFEMVGVPLVDKNYFMYATGYEESNLAGVGNMYVGYNLIGFLPKAKEFNLFRRSDNYPFHEVFNVPSQTFS
ncbi:MAG: M20/M25/M40 family metallo-hydrolase, partial [Flavobacteriaceae bacterium]